MPFWLFDFVLFCHCGAVLAHTGSQGIKGWSQQDWGELLGGGDAHGCNVWQSASSNPCLFFPFEIDVKKKIRSRGRLELCTTSVFVRRKREQNSDATIILTVKKKETE